MHNAQCRLLNAHSDGPCVAVGTIRSSVQVRVDFSLLSPNGATGASVFRFSPTLLGRVVSAQRP